MALWAMSDRTIARSFRLMEGFGVHTFRLRGFHLYEAQEGGQATNPLRDIRRSLQPGAAVLRQPGGRRVPARLTSTRSDVRSVAL